MSHAARFDQEAIVEEVVAAQRELERLLHVLSPAELRARSRGTKWTNEQLLFHMVFGYIIVQTLLPLVTVVSRLPRPFGRGFARMLNASTLPFNFVNYWGSCVGVLVFNRRRMGRKFNRVGVALLRRADRETDAHLSHWIPFPTRWDPFFMPVMTIADLYHYPTQHFQFHRSQLSAGIAKD
jgi:hypothetical protein